MTKKTDNKKIEAKLMDLAHQGTKEAIDKIEKIIKNTKDSDLIGFAGCALDECYFIYLMPDNEEEERDFLLAKMIDQKENKIIDLEIKAGKLEGRTKRLAIKQEVHEKIIQTSNKDSRWREWRYQISINAPRFVQERLQEIRDDIEYEEAWVKTAQDTIQNEKYKKIPYGMIKNIHSIDDPDDEDEDDWLFC